VRYFIDTEFIEDGKTIDLVSIGIVAEDGRESYMQSVEFEHRKASEWVKEHVLLHLVMCPHTRTPRFDITGLYRADKAYHKRYGGQCTFEEPDKGLAGAYADCPWRTREQMKSEVLAFLNPDRYGYPELWGYYSAYDHVAFAQIFGAMMDLPSGFPMYTRDIKQWCDALGCSKLPEQSESEHNALHDARWNKSAWQFLRNLEERAR